MKEGVLSLIRVQIRTEQDIVAARQRARQVANFLGFDVQDQTRIATAVSELARNVEQYARTGSVEFSFEQNGARQTLRVRVSDEGPGIPHLADILAGRYQSPTGMGVGLTGTRRVMDDFRIESTEGRGTVVTIGKDLPATVKPVDPKSIPGFCQKLGTVQTGNAFEEVKRQNHELMAAMDLLNERQEELNQINKELEDTNRGVLALYAELDEKASILQRANEVKTGFLSNMTHEFRTPLTSILSLTRLLLDRLDGDLTSEQERQVKYVRQSAEGLLELVNDLLDLAKVEAGKITIKTVEFTVENVFSGLRGVFKSLLPAEGSVELRFEISAELKELKTDEAKVSQILRNLISNAVKYTEKGSVTVSARASQGDTVLLAVQDTGLGIAPEHLAQIFDDFTQIDSNLQRKSRGTGLGLPLSRKLARILGGELWVESWPGTGSTFFVRIPRVFSGDVEGILFGEAPAGPGAPPAEPVKPLPQPLFLLIDDDEASRYILKNVIQMEMDSRFAEVSVATTGLQQALRQKPDAIFLDLAMPDMNGFEVLRRLKEEPRLTDVPVIVNTAKLLSPDEKDLLSQLTVGILSKERTDRERATEELRTALKNAGFNLRLESRQTSARELRA